MKDDHFIISIYIDIKTIYIGYVRFFFHENNPVRKRKSHSNSYFIWYRYNFDTAIYLKIILILAPLIRGQMEKILLHSSKKILK